MDCDLRPTAGMLASVFLFRGSGWKHYSIWFFDYVGLEQGRSAWRYAAKPFNLRQAAEVRRYGGGIKRDGVWMAVGRLGRLRKWPWKCISVVARYRPCRVERWIIPDHPRSPTCQKSRLNITQTDWFILIAIEFSLDKSIGFASEQSWSLSSTCQNRQFARVFMISPAELAGLFSVYFKFSLTCRSILSIMLLDKLEKG